MLGFPPNEVVALYPIEYLARSETMHIMLVECRSDRVDHAGEVLVLFDIICRDQDLEDRAVGSPHIFHQLRIARRWRSSMSLLGALGMSVLLNRHLDQISLFLNGEAWSTVDLMHRQLHHGDHVEVIFLEPTTAIYQAHLREWTKTSSYGRGCLFHVTMRQSLPQLPSRSSLPWKQINPLRAHHLVILFQDKVIAPGLCHMCVSLNAMNIASSSWASTPILESSHISRLAISF